VASVQLTPGLKTDSQPERRRAGSATSRAGPLSRLGSSAVVVIGAGPYGLSAAAHLLRAGVSMRAFGEPMESWAHHMPVGMLLRSRRDASQIADPDYAFGLDRFESASGLEGLEPIPLARFVDYGRWFQEQAVPVLERRRVARVSADAGSFRVELDDGEALRAERVVVAAGIAPFASRLPQLAGQPGSLVSHTADHSDLGGFAGQRVAVVGGGQSALESAALLTEAGADVEVVARGIDVRWLPAESAGADSSLRFHAYRKIALGGPTSAWLAAWPGLVRRLPYRARPQLIAHFVKPAGAGWLRPRMSSVALTLGRSIDSASQQAGKLRLDLDDGSRREVDHVLMATGYRVDLARYGLLTPELVGRVRTRNGSPVLATGFESSVPGLHFLGAPAAASFGPVMHFVCGTWASARGLTRALVGRRSRRAGFSW
jgi:thioredoxin reductase